MKKILNLIMVFAFILSMSIVSFAETGRAAKPFVRPTQAQREQQEREAQQARMRASEEARAQKEKEAEKAREAQLKALRERQMRENVIPAKMRQQTNRDNPRN